MANEESRWWRPRRFFSLIGQLLLVLLLVLGFERFLTKDALLGPVPDLTWTAADGSSMTLEQMRGRPTLVYFWATWCPVCKVEKLAMDGLVRDHQMVTVAMQSGSEDEVRDWLAKEGLAWPLVADADGSIAREWGVKGVPAFFILDARGESRFVSRGLTSPWGLRLRLWLAAFD